VKITSEGMDLELLEEKLKASSSKFGYIIPSYHNPTGIVMNSEKRSRIYDLFRKYEVPIIEDGFNEELLYSGAHISPLITLSSGSNGVIYIGSFSKILFPGIRIGWILADKGLVNILESVKRARNIHTSFLDQGILYDYLSSGVFDKYLKRIRKLYREKYIFTKLCIEKYIPFTEVYGEGGLHIFMRLNQLSSREVLSRCYKKGVIFMPGDIFYTDDLGTDTLRIGIARLTLLEIERGIKIIGSVIKEMSKKI
jgi:DNA-binding transcriptional MocR family regulator